MLRDIAFVHRLMHEVVAPLAKLVYKELGDGLCAHHGFVVEYEPGKDTRLGFHVDGSQVSRPEEPYMKKMHVIDYLTH